MAGKTRLINVNKDLSRESFLFPWIGVPLKERLIKSGAIDLTDNHIIKKLDNGYIQISPIDVSKKIK